MNRYLRNHGLVSETEYNGMYLDEAKEYAKNGGFEFRVVEIDGNPLIIDMSVMNNRVNFRVNRNKIIGVYTG